MEERKDSIQTPRTIASEVSKAQTQIDEYLTTSEEYANEMRLMEEKDPDHLYEFKSDHVAESDLSESESSEEEDEMEQSGSTDTQNRLKMYYQCLCLGLVIFSAVMMLALIIHFLDLSGHVKDRLAYYRYLHTALGIRQDDIANGRNTTVMEACYAAIHDEEVIILYESASIYLRYMDVNQSDILTAKAKAEFHSPKDRSHVIRNKKYRLIALCDFELTQMINKMKRKKAEYERIDRVRRVTKAREDGKNALMENAIRNWNKTNAAQNTTIHFIVMIEVCDMALSNETVLAFYEKAYYNMTDLRWKTKVVPKDVYKWNMRPREDIILECAMNLFVYELIDAHNKLNGNQSVAVTEEGAVFTVQESIRREAGDPEYEW